MSGWSKLAIIALLLSALFFSCRKNISRIPDPTDPEVVDTIPNTNPPDTIPEPEPAAYRQQGIQAEVNANCGGFYEALPPSYDSSSKTYPLLIFVHGGGELGNGASELPLVLKHGIPKILNQKKFPLSFTVNGESFSFIIISPQFRVWPVPGDMQAVVDYAKAHYRVDLSRIYLSGFSMGGGATWEYAANAGSSLAAITPIAGASWADSAIAKKIAKTNVPVWAFHNYDDSAVTINSTLRYVRMINAFHPSTLARMTLRETGGHDCSLATDPAYKEEDKNIYEWMLQYKR